MTENTYDRLTVHVPHTVKKYFKSIVKALGCEIEKKNALDEALDDVMAGRVYEAKDGQDMIRQILG